ncbi:MAG: DUF4149 domain-containing protein [Candidatus Marinimicrobia bacterium]|nr:DUF4149 domain-containing protein [Candidatus Neomarinimicrobiota bacterium]
MDFLSLATFGHLVAAVTWLGGIIYINLVLLPIVNTLEPSTAGKLMSENAKRFSIIAWVSIGLLIITGSIMLDADALFDFSTDFGTFLTLKLITVLIMIIIGLYITLLLAPKIRKLAPAEGDAPTPVFLNLQKRLPLLIKTNMILGILVLFFVSMII